MQINGWPTNWKSIQTQFEVSLHVRIRKAARHFINVQTKEVADWPAQPNNFALRNARLRAHLLESVPGPYDNKVRCPNRARSVLAARQLAPVSDQANAIQVFKGKAGLHRIVWTDWDSLTAKSIAAWVRQCSSQTSTKAHNWRWFECRGPLRIRNAWSPLQTVWRRTAPWKHVVKKATSLAS